MTKPTSKNPRQGPPAAAPQVPHDPHPHEHGIALVGVILVAAILLAVGVFGTRNARLELRIARNELLAHQALALAEAGLEHAFALIRADADGFNDELATTGTGGAIAALGTSLVLEGTSYRFRTAGAGLDDGYYVRVEDNFDETSGANDSSVDRDQTVQLISRGRAGSADRTVVAAIGSSSSNGPDCAILVDRDLKISGNAIVTGTRACAHANQDTTVSGNPTFQSGITSSNTLDVSGNPTVESGAPLQSAAEKDAYEASHDFQPRKDIPSVRPLNFGPDGINLANAVRALGGFRLDADCRVYNSATTWTCGENPPNCTGGTVVANLSTGAKWNGWECSSDSGATPRALWKVSSDTVANGAFFVEGWVNISGSPGLTTPIWNTTLVALNSIDISGNPVMAPFSTTGDLRNVLLASGNDVGMGGNLGATGRPAGIFAHQQVKNNGNFALNGFLVAEDGRTTWSGDPAPTSSAGRDIVSDSYELSGNPQITYNGADIALLGATPVRRLSWCEARPF